MSSNRRNLCTALLVSAAVMAGETASSIVEGLILDGLKRFSLPADLHERASKRQSTQSSPPTQPLESQAEISGQAA